MVKLYNNAHVLTKCQKDCGGGSCRRAAAVAEAGDIAEAVAEAGGNGAVSVLMILRNRDGAVKLPIFDVNVS